MTMGKTAGAAKGISLVKRKQRKIPVSHPQLEKKTGPGKSIFLLLFFRQNKFYGSDTHLKLDYVVASFNDYQMARLG